MPFIAPILAAVAPALIGGASAGAGIAGAIEQGQAGGRQQKALDIQEQIAQQEMADRQKIFNQLQPFFSQYLQQGSPFLQMIQRAGAEQNAQQFNNAAGQTRQAIQRSGFGYGPSGTEAAALSGLGTQAAQQGSQNYLQNLLNNEQLKFQAASGLQGIGQMAGAGQNQPNVSAQLPYQSLGGGLSGLGQILKSLSGGGTTGTVASSGVGGLPLSPINPTSWPFMSPTTQGGG